MGQLLAQVYQEFFNQSIGFNFDLDIFSSFCKTILILLQLQGLRGAEEVHPLSTSRQRRWPKERRKKEKEGSE